MKHQLDRILRHIHPKEKPERPSSSNSNHSHHSHHSQVEPVVHAQQPPQAYGQPPQQSYGQPPQYSQPPQYGQPPQQAYGQPPQSYGRPPLQSYAQSPPQSYGQTPQFYGQPPQQSYAQSPPQSYAQPTPQSYAQPTPQASQVPNGSSEPLSVFAHFLIGTAGAMTAEQWERDIIEAQKAHIDGFALNIAPQDDYTDRVLQKAYHAAERIGNFSLFISFDYLSGGPWPLDRVITIINEYKNRPAQYLYKGKPLVSTFEGTQNWAEWPQIKSATGCMFMPSWTSLSPAGLHSVQSVIDGAFSWDAWPVGAQDMNTSSDKAWIEALSGKPYMMAVSPWFYTNLPQWNKNWLWRGDDLWHYRWRQVMDVQPELIQILSWNDYGESHYIGPIYDAGIPDGASRYVKGCPHDAWREFLPHYIDAYRRQAAMVREGVSNPGAVRSYAPKRPLSYSDKIVYWYRLNPSNSGSSGGTTGNNPNAGQPELKPGEVMQDRVFVSVLVTEPSQVYVQIGHAAPTVIPADVRGLSHFSVPFNGQTGPVKFAIVRHGREMAVTWGPAITGNCTDGLVNWNAFVGSS